MTDLDQRLTALRRAYRRYDRLERWLLRLAAAGLIVTVLLTLDLLRSLP